MKPIKYSSRESIIVNLGTKVIYKFPTQTKLFDLARMVVNGRHPENPKEFILESDCHFMIYVIKGKGKIYAGDKVFQVVVGDVIDVPPGNKFACEGKDFEYIISVYIQRKKTIFSRIFGLIPILVSLFVIFLVGNLTLSNGLSIEGLTIFISLSIIPLCAIYIFWKY